MGLFGTSKKSPTPSSVVELTPAPRRSAGERFIGKTFLGKYRIVKFLGEGSNAHVLLAHTHGDAKKPVVVKRIKEEAATAPRFRQFFEAEVKSMNRFRHPYSVRLLDAAYDDPLGAGLVLEYIAGSTLEGVLYREKVMTPDRVGRFLGPLGHALYAAQLGGIAHRDLKPANLMVTDYGTDKESLRVMDFGFAGFTQKPHIQLAELTGHGAIFACGTPAYVSPEMVRGDSTDARADIYSVGVMLYEMLTGRLPFDYDTQEKLLEGHLREQPPKFHRIGRGDLSAAVEGTVQLALAKYPSERQQSMKELVDQFSRAVGWDIWAMTAPITDDSTLQEALNQVEISSAETPALPDANNEKFVLSDRFDATMPEKLAALKLKGFIDDVHGQVLESEPGLIRVRVEMPANYRQQEKRGSGVIAFLSGVVRMNTGPVKGKEPIEIELRMKKLEQNKVAVLVAFRPVEGLMPTDADRWAERCEAYYSHLRKYVMPEG